MDNFIIRTPRWIFALCIVALGSILAVNSFDVSNDLGTPPYALLNLIYGAAWPATLLNWIVTKIAMFGLLWGILEVFNGMERPLGGPLSALILGLHPLVTANTGRLGPIVVGMAAMVWLWRLALTAPRKFGLSLLLSAIAAGMIFLSPWFGVLIGLLPVWLSGTCNKRMASDLTGFPKPVRSVQRLALAIGLLLLALVWAALTGAEGLADWRSAILNKQGASVGKAWLLFGISWQALHGWGVWLLIGLSVGMMTLCRPEAAFSIVAAIGATSRWIRLDLGGELVLWLLLALLAGCSFDVLWHYLAARSRAILWQNLLVIGVTLGLLASFRPYLLLDLLEARMTYFSADFQHECNLPAPNVERSRLVLSATQAQGDRCWLLFGKQHYAFPGAYQMTVYAAQSGATSSYSDVTQANGRVRLSQQTLPPVETLPEQAPLPALILRYDTSQEPFVRVEPRLYYAGQGDVYFDRIKLEALR